LSVADRRAANVREFFLNKDLRKPCLVSGLRHRSTLNTFTLELNRDLCRNGACSVISAGEDRPVSFDTMALRMAEFFSSTAIPEGLAESGVGSTFGSQLIRKDSTTHKAKTLGAVSMGSPLNGD
jgi:hypothetical protein